MSISEEARAHARAALAAMTDEEEAAIQAGITQDPDNPELTDQDFARMRPAAEVLPERLGSERAARLLRPRGRPVKENPKQSIRLRVDADVLAWFRESGPGWQTRMNAALRKAVGLN